jgi:hypothetical protein
MKVAFLLRRCPSINGVFFPRHAVALFDVISIVDEEAPV